MTVPDDGHLDLLYPDVLGAVTGGPRIYMNDLQCAVGLFPKQAFINQPLEVVLILQNMVDQNMQVKVGIRLPTVDRRDDPVIMEIAKTTISLGLAPGEVGVLRVPVVAHPPTQPGKGFPVRVAIRYRIPHPGKTLRSPGGGAPPSVLAISPFKLQVLREVEFSAHTWNESAEIITSYFDIVPKRIPLTAQNLQPNYETLWTQEQMPKEEELARAHIPEAHRLANSAEFSSSYPAFLDAVTERFADRGLPLHPGEAKAIAKMMAYTVDEALQYEQTIRVEETRWFKTLCQVLAHDEAVHEMDRNDLLAKYVFDATLYDAILMGFRIIASHVHEDLGTYEEQVQYATRIIAWFAGHGQPDLAHVYLPLVLAGVAINRIVRYSRLENPWEMLDDLREASQGRARLVSGESIVVFDMLDTLLSDAEKQLNYQRIRRGSGDSL